MGINYEYSVNDGTDREVTFVKYASTGRVAVRFDKVTDLKWSKLIRFLATRKLTVESPLAFRAWLMCKSGFELEQIMDFFRDQPAVTPLPPKPETPPDPAFDELASERLNPEPVTEPAPKTRKSRAKGKRAEVAVDK